MGQLRQAQCPVGAKRPRTLRAQMLPPLLIGFMLSSLAVFAVARIAGGLVPSPFGGAVDLAVIAVLVWCVVTDLVFPKLRPTLINRQTPRTLTARFSLGLAGLLWGLDTGSAVSTFRTSAASWGALALTFAGWGPWWVGVSYGASFCAPLALAVATYPSAGSIEGHTKWHRKETEVLVAVLVRGASGLRVVAAMITALALCWELGWTS